MDVSLERELLNYKTNHLFRS